MVMHSHLASFSVKTLFMKLVIFVILRANGNYSKLTSDSESTKRVKEKGLKVMLRWTFFRIWLTSADSSKQKV